MFLSVKYNLWFIYLFRGTNHKSFFLTNVMSGPWTQQLPSQCCWTTSVSRLWRRYVLYSLEIVSTCGGLTLTTVTVYWCPSVFHFLLPSSYSVWPACAPSFFEYSVTIPNIRYTGDCDISDSMYSNQYFADLKCPFVYFSLLKALLILLIHCSYLSFQALILILIMILTSMGFVLIIQGNIHALFIMLSS